MSTADTLAAAEILRDRGDFASAIETYRLAIALDPDLAQAWHGLALALHQNAQPAEAIEAFRRAIALRPDYAEAHNNLGAVLARHGRLEDAIACFRSALAIHEAHPDAHHNLGMALHKLGRTDDAVSAYTRAIALRDDYAPSHLCLAAALRAQNRLEPALTACRHAIALREVYPEAHHQLGLILQDLGRRDDAITALRRAVALRAAWPEAHQDLGEALEAAGQTDQAAAAYARAADLQDRSAQAQNRVGLLQLRMGQFPAAAATFSRALALKEDFPEAHNNLGLANLGVALLDASDGAAITRAVANFRRAIALAADDVAAHLNLADALERRGEIPQAIAVLRDAQCINPRSPTLAVHLAALGAAAAPPTWPAEFVLQTFDPYAGYFDEHLVRRLQYKAPEYLRDAVLASAPRPPLDIIDIGCGTGLCGLMLRPMARRLVGVDLSPRMLQQARRRGIYDELIHEDLTAALRQRPASFDLIVAGDVLIYVGNLADLFPAAARALRHGGLFAFSVESAAYGDFVLRPTRRYAHSLPYLRRLRAAHGFAEVSVRPVTLRLDKSAGVDGLIVLLRRPSGPVD